MAKKNTHKVLVPFGTKKVGDEVYFTDKSAQQRFEDMGYVVKKELKSKVETKELKNDTDTK